MEIIHSSDQRQCLQGVHYSKFPILKEAINHSHRINLPQSIHYAHIVLCLYRPCIFVRYTCTEIVAPAGQASLHGRIFSKVHRGSQITQVLRNTAIHKTDLSRQEAKSMRSQEHANIRNRRQGENIQKT